MNIEEFRKRDFTETSDSPPHLKEGDIFYRKFMPSLPWERCVCTGASRYPKEWLYPYTPHKVINGTEHPMGNMHLRNDDLRWLVMARSIAFSLDEVHSETIAVVAEMEMAVEARVKQQLDIIIANESARIRSRLLEDISEIRETTASIGATIPEKETYNKATKVPTKKKKR